MKTIIFKTLAYWIACNWRLNLSFGSALAAIRVASRFSILIFGVCLYVSASATIRTAIGNAGQGWSNTANWSPSGVPQSGDTVIIPSGVTLKVKGAVYGSSTPTLLVRIAGVLDFDPSGKLELSNSSVFKINSGGRINSNGTSSEIIKIGNAIKFNGQLDGSVHGPAEANASSGSSPNGFYNSILSIKLHSFRYEKKGQQVILNWMAASDNIHDKFEVQRSNPGSNWVSIAQVPVRNDNNEMLAYSFTDLQPQPGINYYRLKLINSGTEQKYSSILVANFSTKTAGILLSPNPAVTEARISWALPDTSGAVISIRVFNAASACVLDKKVPASDNVATLAVGHLPAGLYRVLVTDSRQFTETANLMINK